jgi:Fe2+ or Zn2+ uptake regulation protein
MSEITAVRKPVPFLPLKIAHKGQCIVLNDALLRMTRQRRVILQELRKTMTHPSADEVYEMVRKLLPRISLGTVYRNLEILSELGEIQKIEICGKLKRFDANIAEHYHLRCLNCHRIDDVPEHIHFDFNTSLNAQTGYAITGHRLEFVGLCPECSDLQSNRLSQKIDSHMNRPSPDRTND